MKRAYFLSVATLILGVMVLCSNVDANPTKSSHLHHNHVKVVNSGNTKATGGAGGTAKGPNAKGGDGGKADAKGGSISIKKEITYS